MNPAVEKLESLLARIAKNRLAPRDASPETEAPRVAAADVTVNRAATPMPAPVAPSRAATPMPAPVSPVSTNVAPAATAPTPAPVAPIAAKKPEAKTIELELDAEVIEPTRHSEPELELSPIEPVAAKADVELAPLDADDDGPEIVAEASGDEPVFVLDDEPEDAEIIEPVRAVSTAPAQAQVTEIEITIEPAPTAAAARSATPMPAPAAATDFDEMSFADVDIDTPPPPVVAPKPKESTPLEAAVQAVGPKTSEAPRPIAPTPAVVAPVAVAAVVPVAAPAVAQAPLAPGAAVEAEQVVAATADVVRVVAASKPVEQETFGALMKRSLGLRLR